MERRPAIDTPALSPRHVGPARDLPSAGGSWAALGAAGVLVALFLRWLAGPLPPDPVRVAGLEFPNRIGLAAGFDKDARVAYGLALLGFGHLELGTVTPLPQAGNPS